MPPHCPPIGASVNHHLVDFHHSQRVCPVPVEVVVVAGAEDVVVVLVLIVVGAGVVVGTEVVVVGTGASVMLVLLKSPTKEILENSPRCRTT